MKFLHPVRQRTKAIKDRVLTWSLTQPWLVRLFLVSVSLVLSEPASADGAIPTPSADDDPTQGGGDFVTVLKNIIKKEVGPVLIYGGAVFLVVMAVFDMYRGYKKYQDTDDFGKFKMSIVAGGLMIVVALVLFFLGQHILTAWT